MCEHCAERPCGEEKGYNTRLPYYALEPMEKYLWFTGSDGLMRIQCVLCHVLVERLYARS